MGPRRRTTWRALAVRAGLPALGALAAVVLVACGSSDGGGSPGPEATVVGQATPGDAGEAGGAGPDAPVDAAGDQGSADLPGLPVGGLVVLDDPSDPLCKTLAWAGATQLPAGVAVRITALTLPSGVAVDTGTSCVTPCLGADSFTSERTTCEVPLVWEGSTVTSRQPAVGASGVLVCTTQALCDEVLAAVEAGGTGAVAGVELPASAPTSTHDPAAPANGS